METVTLEVASREEVSRRVLKAFKGKKQGTRVSFATPELLWKVLTAKRWELYGRPRISHSSQKPSRGVVGRVQALPALVDNLR